MVYFVIETRNSKVISAAYFPIVPGFDAKTASEEYAKGVCKNNGIVFDGDISCDGSIENYSVQLFKQNTFVINL